MYCNLFFSLDSTSQFSSPPSVSPTTKLETPAHSEGATTSKSKSNMSNPHAHSSATSTSEQEREQPAPPQIGIKRAVPVHLAPLAAAQPPSAAAASVAGNQTSGFTSTPQAATNPTHSTLATGGLEISFKDGDDGWLIVRVRRFV
jgi:hypothetical protein